MGRPPLKNSIVKKVVALAIQGKDHATINRIVPSISKTSIERIKKSHIELIQESKKKYINLIDRTTGGDPVQATKLSELLDAETELYNFKGDVVGTRPDYKTRLDTIKYIDKLKGRDSANVQVNTQINNTINSVLDRYSK